MEYFVYVTEMCNLNCSYCSGCNIHHGVHRSERLRDPKRVLDAIIQDIQKHGQQANRVIFYGGEPLLNQPDINFLLEGLQAIDGIKFGLYTNGTLLRTIDESIRDALQVLFLSVDGTEKEHDRWRGRGTYRIVMEGVEEIAASFGGKIVANVTITPESSVFEAITALADRFGHIHWNIVNGLSRVRFDGFLGRYEKDLPRLLDSWIERLRKGQFLNLVPFQSVVVPLITGKRYHHFRCGCGTDLRVVDTDGTFWLCDELRGNTRFRISESAEIDPEKWLAVNHWTECRNCDALDICGGGCLVNMLFHPLERRSIYCPATKHLFRVVRERLPSIEESLGDGSIDWAQIETDVGAEGWTECIP